MLTLVTAKEIRPEIESQDRDPGVISLVAAFARFTVRQTAAIGRALDQRTTQAEVFSSSTAWPYRLP